MEPVNLNYPRLSQGLVLNKRYRVDTWIGGGGFGNVYKISDIRLGHVRALKESFGYSAGIRDHLWLEADLLVNSRHPNIPRGYNTFEENGLQYLVMDYVDGQDLYWILQNHIQRFGLPLKEIQVIKWLIPVCSAIAYIHHLNVPIIHRDIKPANIKITTNGVPVLIDFGLAKLAGKNITSQTPEAGFTRGYAPPEQSQQNGWTDQRSDIYALGATIYHLLTGQVPMDAQERLNNSSSIPPPRAFNPALSSRIEELILRSMALDSVMRPQNFHFMITELESIYEDLTKEMSNSGFKVMEQQEKMLIADDFPTDPKRALSSATNEMKNNHPPSTKGLKCRQCGRQNVPTAKYCTACDYPLNRQ